MTETDKMVAATLAAAYVGQKASSLDTYITAYEAMYAALEAKKTSRKPVKDMSDDELAQLASAALQKLRSDR